MATKGLKGTPIISKEQMNDKINLFSDVVIDVDGNLDFHEHHGEAEVYYILEGTGLYNDDNEKEYTVKAGDVTYCGDGHGHGIANTSDVPLRFIALIIRG